MGPNMARPGPSPRLDRGAVGGVEVLPFALLVFVAGTLLIANAWAVVDAKLAAESAAREAGRAYVEAGDGATAASAASNAARTAIEGAGRDSGRLGLTDNAPGYVRCTVVEHEASYRVPTVTIPFVGGFGDGITVRGRHREILDPFAAGLGPEQDCAR
ncbi:hypothetical protein BH23ACT2_BH23ACT2_28250 [soil metagenome]